MKYFRTFKTILGIFLGLLIASTSFLYSAESTFEGASLDGFPKQKVNIIGGGIIGALEAYTAYLEAQKNGEKILIAVYDKGKPFKKYTRDYYGAASTNTAYNIVPSLTIDEILSVVPRGSEMMQKLAILFSEPGGIRVDDVPGVNDSEAAIRFKEEVALYGTDKNHDDRTETLLGLGKMSMDLWQNLYGQADQELKGILEESNFHPCHEPNKIGKASLHDGYRIDLIYDVRNAEDRARKMLGTYEKFGYKFCKILTPDEVAAIDPSLSVFCNSHSEIDLNANRIWKNDSAALWRPGGCIDTHVFLPKFYKYLKKTMGKYTNALGENVDCFQLTFEKEAKGLIFEETSTGIKITGLKFSDGTVKDDACKNVKYVFCPGEAVGTLYKLGFDEPAYAGFAGPSLFLNIPASAQQLATYKNFNHCMEVHKEGIVLAWQARIKDDKIFIGVAGTKAFYGDQLPHKDEAFGVNRHLVQLNMINDVLPEFVTIGLGYDSRNVNLTQKDLKTLEDKGLIQRWVGRRAVAYDGFPTLGPLYCNGVKVVNARCTTHLGSGGVSFAPAAVKVSRSSEKDVNDPFIAKVLMYADSRRAAEKLADGFAQ